MKRTELTRRAPLRRAVPFDRSRTIAPSVGSSAPTGQKRAAQGNTGRRGRSARKAASDAAMAAIRPALIARAAGHCEVTGRPLADNAGHAHHRKRRGGPELDVLSNLIWVAPQSHLAAYQGSIHAEPEISRRFGWILRPWMNPAAERVLYRGRYVLLDDAGTITPTEGTQT